MLVTLNGQSEQIPDGIDVRALLARRQLTPDRVAVELNRRLLRGEKYDTILKEGDQIEIVTFVGGG
jgi:sulfur carrier protein